MRLLAALLVALLASPAWASSLYDPMLTTDIEGGKLSLVGGLAHDFYWPSGAEGRNQTAMADGQLQGRKYMSEHDGDWCLFMVEVEDSGQVVLDRADSEAIQIVWPDSHIVASEILLALDSPVEGRYWTNESRPLWFHGGCQFARTRGGKYPIYVRFPGASCLTDKSDEAPEFRKFKSKPTAIRARRGGGE